MRSAEEISSAVVHYCNILGVAVPFFKFLFVPLSSAIAVKCWGCSYFFFLLLLQDPPREMKEQAVCMPFSGPAGHVLVVSVAVLSIVLCVARYRWKHVKGQDRRSVRVYAYDMSKLVISQSAAWVVNLFMTAWVFDALLYLQAKDNDAVSYGTRASMTEIEGIGWYASVFLMDFVFGVPLGVWMGKSLNRIADNYWRAWLVQEFSLEQEALPRQQSMMEATFDEFNDELADMINSSLMLHTELPCNAELPCLARYCEQNRIYGKYERHHSGTSADDFVDQWGPQLDIRWWWSQTLSFSAVIGVSRLASGVCMIGLLYAYRSPANPIVVIAQVVTDLPFTCAEKQWLVAGLMRCVIDVVMLLIFDAVLKFRSKDEYRAVEDDHTAESHEGEWF